MLCWTCLFLCLCVRPQYVVYEWAVRTRLSAQASMQLLQIHTALYKHSYVSHSATERNCNAHITVDKMYQWWAKDSLNISVQYHYETEIVFAHSWCHAGSCPDRNKILNTDMSLALTSHFSVIWGHLLFSLDRIQETDRKLGSKVSWTALN